MVEERLVVFDVLVVSLFGLVAVDAEEYDGRVLLEVD